MKVYTTGQFAWLIRKSTVTVLRWIMQGKLPHCRIGRYWLIVLTDEEAREYAERYGVRWEDMEKYALSDEELKRREGVIDEKAGK